MSSGLLGLPIIIGVIGLIVLIIFLLKSHSKIRGDTDKTVNNSQIEYSKNENDESPSSIPSNILTPAPGSVDHDRPVIETEPIQAVSSEGTLIKKSPETYKIVSANSDGFLYKAPDLQSRIFRSFKKGEKLTLISRQGDFYQVKMRIKFGPEIIGFVIEKVIEEKPTGYMIGPASPINQSKTNQDKPLTTPTDLKVLTAIADGSLYEKPDLQSHVLRGIQKGDKLTLIGRHGSFYQLKKMVGFDLELTGYVEEKVIEEKPIGYKIKRMIVSLNGKIFTKPDITATTLSEVREGDRVVILDEAGEFYRVKLESNNEITGYVEKDLLASRRAVVSLKGPMFSQPDINSSAVCELFLGDKLIILDEIEKFYRVKLESDRSIIGYIGKELIEPVEDIKEQPAVSQIRTPEAQAGTSYNYYKRPADLHLTAVDMGVSRPGLTSFVGYWYAVIGWIDIVGSIIFLLIVSVGGGELARFLPDFLRYILGGVWGIGIISLIIGIIYVATGKGVLKGGGAARFFATIWSLSLIPTIIGIIFFILFMVGLYGGDAKRFFDYHKKTSL